MQPDGQNRLSAIAAIYVTMVVIFMSPISVAAPQYTDEMVQETIRKLTASLLDRQGPDGSWEYPGYPVGCTALVLLGLTQADLPEASQPILKAKSFLLSRNSAKTYGESLLLCALEPWAEEANVRRRMDMAAKHLVSWQTKSGGWTYGDGSEGEYYDFSNTQFAILGLAAARRVGIGEFTQEFRKAEALWMRALNKDGGWGYREGNGSYAAMTSAGAASLHLIGRRLEQPDRKCGNYRFDHTMVDALRLLRKYVRDDNVYGHHQANVLYAWYALERVAIFLNIKTFGEIDWYAAGIPKAMQALDPRSQTPDVTFALLFLAKAATPLAICKWKWKGDWNNDHADVQNWVEEASHRFKKKLDWLSARLDTPNSPAAKASLIFVNGHLRFSFRKAESEFLRRFMKDGGTVIAEPCCGSRTFAESFRDTVCRELYPGIIGHFRRIPDDHPIYSAHYQLKPTIPIYQYARSGCRKQRMFILGADISCALNGEDTPPGHEIYAKKLAVNLLAFAISQKQPKGKLNQATLSSDVVLPVADMTADQVIRKQSVQGAACAHPFGRLKHRGDWHADPLLFRRLKAALAEHDSVPEFDQEVYVDPESTDLFNVPILFMNGHGDPELTDEAIVNLRLYVQNGGFLVASACCSSPKFHQGFVSMLKRVLPNDSLEKIPQTDLIYSTPFSLNDLPAEGNKPYKAILDDRWADLWGIRRAGRWVVVYSSIDFCCGFEDDVGEAEPAYLPASSARLLLNILANALRIE